MRRTRSVELQNQPWLPRSPASSRVIVRRQPMSRKPLLCGCKQAVGFSITTNLVSARTSWCGAVVKQALCPFFHGNDLGSTTCADGLARTNTFPGRSIFAPACALRVAAKTVETFALLHRTRILALFLPFLASVNACLVFFAPGEPREHPWQFAGAWLEFKRLLISPPLTSGFGN